MANPFLGQIQTFGFNFAPRGWALCNGQILPISQNTALFSLLGTIYGGDGRTTFALPELRGRAALHYGTGPGLPDFRQGVKGGTTTNKLTTAQLPAHDHQMPAHNHKFRAANVRPDTTIPGSTKLLARSAENLYANPGALVTLDDTAPNQAISEAGAGPTSNTGGGTVVNNLQPYLVIEMCIAITGVYPSRN